MKTTTHPLAFDFRARFPNAREAYVWEGGCAYTAERDGIAYVIKDSGTMADFLAPEDLDLLDSLVQVIAFESEGERDDYVRSRRLALATGRA